MRATAKAQGEAETKTGKGDDDALEKAPSRGVWGGLGPDREWVPLPPAPEGPALQRQATDGEIDIFADLAAAAEEQAKAAEESAQPQDLPEWRTLGSPLFSDLKQDSRLSESDLFDDAVGRLAMLGFDPTKCHIALEAAGGDENLARDFLSRET